VLVAPETGAPVVCEIAVIVVDEVSWTTPELEVPFSCLHSPEGRATKFSGKVQGVGDVNTESGVVIVTGVTRAAIRGIVFETDTLRKISFT
jgi:hypothetical protein